MTTLPATDAALVAELRQLIAAARQRAAVAVNAELTLLYWQVGDRIHREILGSRRAGYGEEIVSALGRLLSMEYGRGFSAKNLRHMVRFAQTYPDHEIVSTLRRQLSWTHIKALIYVDDAIKRDFYTELCRLEGWSSRQLYDRMQSMLFERSAISRLPEETIRHDLQVLRHEQIELLELDKSGIHVAEYLTVLPPREVLQARLHESIERARARVLEDKGDRDA